MGLNIDPSQLSVVHAHAAAGYPHEVVGLLAGRRSDNRVSHAEALVNERSDSPQNRYQVSALALARAEQRLESVGLEIVGYYHSHPDHPSQYSDFDRDHALPNMSYMIVSVVRGEIVTTQSWRLREDREVMIEEAVTRAIPETFTQAPVTEQE